MSGSRSAVAQVTCLLDARVSHSTETWTGHCGFKRQMHMKTDGSGDCYAIETTWLTTNQLCFSTTDAPPQCDHNYIYYSYICVKYTVDERKHVPSSSRHVVAHHTNLHKHRCN